MVARKRVSARTPWEETVGYSRAVKVGKVIVVSGTAPSDARGVIVGKDDAYAQTIFAIEKIGNALNELGASLEDVVRTRIYTTDISLWKEIARAHRKFFSEVKPANTLVQVSKLIDQDMLVEVEVDAIKD
ncbi:MAG: RidA family protein [Nitrososphaerales archaeon]|nr:RidA family protein [Nitrososphaerales archaeon]